MRIIRATEMAGGGFSFRSVGSGGEALGADLFGWANEFFGCPVNDAYGQTEFSGICGGNSNVFPPRPGSIGRALSGTVVAVLDEAGNPVIGSVGEIAVDRYHPLTMLEYPGEVD